MAQDLHFVFSGSVRLSSILEEDDPMTPNNGENGQNPASSNPLKEALDAITNLAREADFEDDHVHVDDNRVSKNYFSFVKTGKITLLVLSQEKPTHSHHFASNAYPVTLSKLPMV